MSTKKKLQDLAQAAYPLLRLDPLITDVEDPTAIVECVLCDDTESISGAPEKLYWFEYHPSVHATRSNKICDHCLFPPPKNIDFVMCSREKHLYCLYCIELKLFRIQLGRFVMEQEDDKQTDLGLQWERDYVEFRHNTKQSHVSSLSWGRGRGRTRSVADSAMAGNGICNCFSKNKPDIWSEEKEDRSGTTRLAGYNSAQMNSSIIEMHVRNDKKKDKKKKKKKKKGKNDEDDDDSKDDEEDDGKININHVVDEADIDELYQEEFEVDMDEKIVLEQNKKKIKAVEILLEACEKGNRQPPSVIIELNYDKYSVYCFAYVMSKLELKQRPFLFHTLEFIAMVSPTTIMIQLIMQYQKQFLMLPYKKIDSILLSVIRGSKYSIATALKMAALAGEFALIDLSAKETFLKIKEKYESIAVELLKQIESHHLAAVLLETPSDIENMTPLELAFEHKLFSFLAQSKIEKIAHQVWIEQFFLNPTRTFEVSDIDSWNVLEYLKNPYQFYFRPFGKYLTSLFLFMAYLLMFSYILIGRPTIYDVPEPIEVIFWVLNIGYFGFEVYQALIEDGLQDYLTDWTNYIDMSISINFALQIVLRLVWIFGANNGGQCDNNKLYKVEYNYNNGLPLLDFQKCPTTSQIASVSGYWPTACNQTFADWTLPNSTDYLCSFDPTNAFYMSAYDKCNCWKQLDYYLADSCCRKADSTEAVLFNFLYGCNAILLWIRVLYFAEQDSTLGPLIKIIMAMKDDFINYLKLTILFMLGFSFAIRAFIGNYSYEFDKVQSTILYMFKSTFGKIDFSVLEACGDSPSDLCKDKGWVPEWRSNLVQLLIMGYLVLALLMIRLLIAMISFTYNKMIRQAEHQVVYQKIKNAYELDRSSGLMPPPLNIFVFGITIVWLIMDVLMVVLINRYIDVENHLQLAKPIGASYVTRVWHGIQDLFSRNTSYWICAYCKEHNNKVYPIKDYLAQFKPACDPQDAKIVEVYAPSICQRCYRNKTAVGRMTIVLQQISFLVFCIVVYPCLIVIVFIPALFSWLSDFLTDDNENGQWDNTEDDDETKKKAQFKRHQTMSGKMANVGKNKLDKKSPEYKLQKKREKEAKKKKEMIKQAERYRMYRQMQQLETQLNAVPTTELQKTTLHQLKKQLKQIIKGFNPRGIRHILTPNINAIVDEVTSDKTPIAKLQKQVDSLQEMLAEILTLVKASSHFTLATTLANATSNNSENDDDYDDNKGDDNDGGSGGYKPSSLTAIRSQRSPNNKGDDFMISVSKAAEQIQTALNNKPSRPRLGNLPSTQLSNRTSSHKNRKSIKNIASALGLPMLDGDNSAQINNNNNKQSLVLKPTDVMKHKSSYKRKSKNNLLQFTGITNSDDDDDNDDDNKQEEEEPQIKLKNNLSTKTEKYLESLMDSVDDDNNNQND